MEAIRTETDALRAFIGNCEEEEAAVRPDRPSCAAHREAGAGINTPNMRKVINGTGTILHTNLGRAPISPEHMQRAARLVSGYSNLEYNLEEGHRGGALLPL